MIIGWHSTPIIHCNHKTTTGFQSKSMLLFWSFGLGKQNKAFSSMLLRAQALAFFAPPVSNILFNHPYLQHPNLLQ